jgi:hypothetical protein
MKMKARLELVKYCRQRFPTEADPATHVVSLNIYGSDEDTDKFYTKLKRIFFNYLDNKKTSQP